MLHIVKIRVESDYIDKIHKPLEMAILKVSEELQALPEDEEDNGWAESIACEGSEFIEELLGTAFVVVQTYLTGVKSAIGELSDRCKTIFGKTLSILPNTKSANDLFGVGSTVVKDSITEIEIIDAIANYWKHREEWKTNEWGDLEGREKKTAERVQVIGMVGGSSGNLSTAAMRLGVTKLNNLELIRRKAKAWAATLYEKAKSELELLNG